MLNRQTVSLPDALRAMEGNLQAVLELAGKRGTVTAMMSRRASTASVSLQQGPNGTYVANVIFPVMAHDVRLTREVLDRWTGYFLHEISHVLFTDRNAWLIAVGEGLGPIVNGLEDVRIERALIGAAIASNARDRLVELLSWAVAETSPDYDPNDVKFLPWTLAMFGRVRLAGYPLDVVKFDAKLCEPMRSVVARTLTRLVSATCTADVVEIARDLKKPAPSKPIGEEADVSTRKGKTGETGETETGETGETETGETETGETGETETGEGEADEAGESGESEAGESGESEAGESGETETGEGEADEAGESGESEAGESGESEAGESGEGESGESEAGESNGVSDGAGRGEGLDVRGMHEAPDLNPIKRDGHVSMDEDVLVNILADAGRLAHKPVQRVDASGGSGFDQLASEARQCSRLRAQIAAVLRSPELDETSRRRSAGHVDARAMGRLAAGDFAQPFVRKTHRDGWETEIVVLLDGSGSMGNPRRSWCAATLALAITQAAEQVGIAVEVAQFREAGYGRDMLAVVKATHERLRGPQVADRFVGIVGNCDGGTPLSASLAIVAARLVARASGKRKVIFVVTDGECDRGPGMVKAVATDIERRGVEVVGLSIDSSVHDAFAHEVRVDSREDVAAVGLGLLARVLAARGQKVQS